MSQLQIQLPMGADGQPRLPSAAKGVDGKPRFHLPLIKELINADPGVRYVVLYESLYGGYEASSRQFFEEHLAPGDVFVDVGAHWGIFSLSAATRHPGQVRAVAIEPHPLNVMQLLNSIRVNQLLDTVEAVAAAAGATRQTLALRSNSTMGHSLDESVAASKEPVLRVPVVTVDELFLDRPELAAGRVFLKVDVEGFEFEVLSGARRLMESGRVAAVMWEKGHSYNEEPGHGRMLRLIEEFHRYGFTLHRFPSSEYVGPLVPFATTPEVGNVFALAPGFARKPVYELPFEPRPPFNNLFATPADPATRARTTELLLAARSSDGARWANPQELQIGAAERAATAAVHVPPGSRVLDLGAGALALRDQLVSAGCQYTAADLLARSADCRVVDLNQGQFPAGEFDVVALLEVLEFMHDVPALLALCRQAAGRLIVLYNVSHGEPVVQRRQQGWFNDYDQASLESLLQAAGWSVAEAASTSQGMLFVCS